MDDAEFGEINVVPLVDVMLVLLTIVLTTASFVVNGRIPLDLAQAKSAQAAERAALVVSVTHERVVYVDDRAVDDLESALQAHPRDRDVVVRADGRLALAQFVEVIDRIKGLGFTRVSLEVRRS